MSQAPINSLKKRNAVRRKSVGVRNKADKYHCSSIDLACQDFYRSRGLPVYGQFGNPLPAKP